jgi:cytochrome P450
MLVSHALTWAVSHVRNDFAEAFNEVQRVQNIIARVANLKVFVPQKTYREGLDVLNSFINKYVERALSLTPQELEEKTRTDAGYTFLHEVAHFTRDPKVLRDQIVAILLAGRDTTASTLSWTLYELGRHPHAVAKLRNEILDTLGDDPNATPTYQHLKDMPYLKSILNEILRIYPVVPINVRFALTDTTIPFGGGPDGTEPLPILKNDPVSYSPLVMQRRPELYPPVSETFVDPAVFSPERWEHWHPKPHYYIPFNAGPRICIGQQFALTEMSYVLARLFQKYERVESHMKELDGGNPILKSEIVLSPGQGVRVSFYEPEKKG